MFGVLFDYLFCFFVPRNIKLLCYYISLVIQMVYQFVFGKITAYFSPFQLYNTFDCTPQYDSLVLKKPHYGYIFVRKYKIQGRKEYSN